MNYSAAKEMFELTDEEIPSIGTRIVDIRKREIWYPEPRDQLDNINASLRYLKKEMNMYLRDVEYTVYSYDKNYFDVEIVTDLGDTIRFDGEYFMVLGSIEALSDSEINR